MNLDTARNIDPRKMRALPKWLCGKIHARRGENRMLFRKMRSILELHWL
jgi:hypothetical protein